MRKLISLIEMVTLFAAALVWLADSLGSALLVSMLGAFNLDHTLWNMVLPHAKLAMRIFALPC